MGKTIPGGSGGMLRSRRRDINVKPNRVLDRSSTRGMIYENEELRLRTININEEIEKGQNDIKKLRRENDHLRREIWTLREECDRLQELLTQQIEEEEEEEEEEGEDEEEEEEDGDEEEEVDENESGNGERGSDKDEASGEKDKLLGADQLQIHHHEGEGSAKKLLQEVERLSVVPEEPEEGSSTDQNETEITLASNPPLIETETAGDFRVDEYKRGPTPCLRINSIHPFTCAATLDPHVLPNVSVCELIEAIRSKCNGIVGVRLLHGSLYISCASKAALESLLSTPITIRDIPLPLHDVSQGTIVVAMTGVPHHLTDADLAHVLGQFGPVIGGVERRLYRDVDTGERLARIRPVASIPKRLFLQGSEILLRLLSHEELAKMSIQPSPPKPEQHLKFEEKPHPSAPPSTSTPAGGSPQANVRKTGAAPSGETAGDKPNKQKHLQSKASRRMSPSSSSEQESPSKPRRRRSSAFQPSHSFMFDRDKSPSLSSRASLRRKLSTTGRETGKIPWCACWGNGCF